MLSIKEKRGEEGKVTPRPHEHSGTTPSILRVVGVDDEGFTCYDLSDPELIDPTIMNWAQYWDIDGVYEIED